MASTRIVSLATLLPTHIKRTRNWNQIVIIRLTPIKKCLCSLSIQRILTACFRNAFHSSTNFPFPLFVCTRIQGWNVNCCKHIVNVGLTLLMWVWPIPACRQLSATLVFTVKAGGPRFPDLCLPEVFIWLLFPQNKHLMENVLAKLCRVSFVTLWNDSGPM